MKNQKGSMPILLLLAALGLLIYLFATNTFSFKDRLFNTLFPKPPSFAQEGESVPDEILLKFKAGVSDSARENVLKAHGLEIKETIPAIEVTLAKVPEQAKDQVIEALNKNPRVEYAEANFITKAQLIPNDPAFPNSQWNLKKISLPLAWDISTGNSSVLVAVLDTGVVDTHEDLQGQLTEGYNFVTNSTTIGETTGHGTVVTGIVAAVTNNAKGVAGVCWQCKVMPVVVLDSTGSGSYSIVAKGITYAADNGAKIINMSFGGSGPSSTLQDAVNYASNKGAVLSASAGNSGNSGIEYPAVADNVIAVGGTDGSDIKASFSNTGQGLDVVAPGSGIWSTTKEGGYANFSGTSFATPHVAALAGLIMSANPGLTNNQVVDIITSTALDLGDPGWDQYFGFGRIQADKALQKATDTTVITDISAPNISITSPTFNSTVSGLVDISVNATDDIGVTKVDFYVDGILLGSDVSSPYIASWDSTTYSNASHTLTVKAYDLANNTAISPTVSVTVNNPVATPTPTPTPAPTVSDTTPPSVSVSNPTNGSILKANSTAYIQASAIDNTSVSKVEFYVNNSLKCTSAVSPYTCSWKVPGRKNANYTLSAKAYDPSNNSTPASITVKAQ